MRNTLYIIRWLKYTLAHAVQSHPQRAPTCTHTLSSPLTRQTRRTALPQQQRIRTILEHLPELFRSLEIDLLEQLLQHRRGPGQARRRRAAGQARHDELRAPSAFHLGSPSSSLAFVGVFHLCASVLANVNVLGPVESGAAYAIRRRCLSRDRRCAWRTAPAMMTDGGR